MKKLAAILIAGAGVMLFWAIEVGRDVARRDAHTAGTTAYWSCSSATGIDVMRRMYTRRIAGDAHGDKGEISRMAIYWWHYAYVRMVMSDEQVRRDFLATPSRREKGCLPIKIGE